MLVLGSQKTRLNRVINQTKERRYPTCSKKNSQHLQIPLTSHVDELPEKLRNRHEFYSNLNEEPFNVLNADCLSRPNVPVNVLVGLEFMKAGNGLKNRAVGGRMHTLVSPCPANFSESLV